MTTSVEDEENEEQNRELEVNPSSRVDALQFALEKVRRDTELEIERLR